MVRSGVYLLSEHIPRYSPNSFSSFCQNVSSAGSGRQPPAFGVLIGSVLSTNWTAATLVFLSDTKEAGFHLYPLYRQAFVDLLLYFRINA